MPVARVRIVEAIATLRTSLGELGYRPAEEQLGIAVRCMEKRREMPAGKIRRHPGTDMPQAYAILRSIPGVGPVTAAALPVRIPEPGTVGNRQAAALAGVAPHPCDSGDRTGRRSVRAGRRRPGRVLYMAAMAAAKYNAPLAAFHRRLVERGKPHKVAIVAVMRKLVVLANTLLRERRCREDRGPATA